MYNVYKIIDDTKNKVIYIGFTSKDIEVRLCQHLIAAKNEKSAKYHLGLYKYIRENNLGIKTLSIELIESFDCESKAKNFEALKIREYSLSDNIVNMKNEKVNDYDIFHEDLFENAKKIKIKEIDRSSSCKNRNFTMQELYSIYYFATEVDNMSLQDIGNLFGVSKTSLSKILNGETNRFLPDEYYPIRLPNSSGNINTIKKLKDLVYDIYNSDMTNSKIATKHKTSVDTVKRIKNGSFKLLQYIRPFMAEMSCRTENMLEQSD